MQDVLGCQITTLLQAASACINSTVGALLHNLLLLLGSCTYLLCFPCVTYCWAKSDAYTLQSPCIPLQAFLRGQPTPFTAYQLNQLMEMTNAMIQESNGLEREVTNYWLAHYFQAQKDVGRTYTALMLMWMRVVGLTLLLHRGRQELSCCCQRFKFGAGCCSKNGIPTVEPCPALAYAEIKLDDSRLHDTLPSVMHSTLHHGMSFKRDSRPSPLLDYLPLLLA